MFFIPDWNRRATHENLSMLPKPQSNFRYPKSISNLDKSTDLCFMFVKQFIVKNYVQNRHTKLHATIKFHFCLIWNISTNTSTNTQNHTVCSSHQFTLSLVMAKIQWTNVYLQTFQGQETDSWTFYIITLKKLTSHSTQGHPNILCRFRFRTVFFHEAVTLVSLSNTQSNKVFLKGAKFCLWCAKPPLTVQQFCALIC